MGFEESGLLCEILAPNLLLRQTFPIHKTQTKRSPLHSQANCTLISMKAKNPVCAVRRIPARKGHDVAEWIAVQHRDNLHFKQVGVWATLLTFHKVYS